MSCQYDKSYKPEHETCPALGIQEVKVGVPVEIKPFARVGRVKTECIGKPIIDRSGKDCEGLPREVCKFTISQKIAVEVPIIFGAKTEIGEARINCKHCDHKEINNSKEIFNNEEETYIGMIG